MATSASTGRLPVKPQLNPDWQFLRDTFGPVAQPDDGIAFYVSSVGVAVPIGGALTDVVSYTVKEGQRGYLKCIGLTTEPFPSIQSIDWKLLLAGISVSNFGTGSVLRVNANTLATPFTFQMKVNPKQEIKIQASNTGLGAVTCFAILSGWTFPINRV